MNVLVTGANGQLGSELRNEAAGSASRYIFTDVSELPGVQTRHLDMTRAGDVRAIVEEEAVDVIVNCAAYTNVDRAEDDREAADLLNHRAPAILAEAALKSGATLIHISTDYVFHGDACVPYTEKSEASPIGVYGATKLAGEQAILGSGCKAIIFRTAWLYSPYGKNFVKTMRSLTAERGSLSVVFDQIGTPTYARDLAKLIVKVTDGGLLGRTGLYHFTDEGVTSWYDFAVAICALSGNSCDIRPCHSDEFPSKAERPHYSVLDKTLVKETFGVEIPYWLDSLKDCLSRL